VIKYNQTTSHQHLICPPHPSFDDSDDSLKTNLSNIVTSVSQRLEPGLRNAGRLRACISTVRIQPATATTAGTHGNFFSFLSTSKTWPDHQTTPPHAVQNIIGVPAKSLAQPCTHVCIHPLEAGLRDSNFTNSPRLTLPYLPCHAVSLPCEFDARKEYC
jgi:hypothetical protein